MPHCPSKILTEITRFAMLFCNVFLSAFKALIGNLDELKKKDYGDMERGATRYNSR